MATVLDFFVSKFLTDTTNMIEAEIFKVLGVDKEIKALQERLGMIKGYLRQAERKRHGHEELDIWVRKLKDIMYDADDVIDLCMIEGGKLLKARASSSGSSTVSIPLSYLFSCFQCLRYRHEFANQIIALNSKLEDLKKDAVIKNNLDWATKEQIECVHRVITYETSHLQIEGDVIGAQIETATETLIDCILENNPKKCRVFGVVGTGGIGKSTLARKIFEDERIKDCFPNRKWLYVSKNYVESDLLKKLISFEEGSETNGKAELENKLVSVLTRNTFIVLDDVWNSSVWGDFLRTPLMKGAADCAVLVTSRKEKVVEQMKPRYIHPVEKMDEESGWTLLKHLAFEDEVDEDEISSFEEIGIKLVNKCDGLPLAIKAIAGVLYQQNKAKWEEVLDSDAWNMDLNEEELRPLYLSYDDLPSSLKQCFLYCSLYPQQNTYFKELVQCWVAEGLIMDEQDQFRTGNQRLTMEETGEEFYRELICRNLLDTDAHEVSKSLFSMHDHFRSLCAKVMREEGILYRHGREFEAEDDNVKIRRLSISFMGPELLLPDQIIRQACLRTLILTDSPTTKTIEDSVLRALPCLRVLNLTDTSIEKIPDCIEDLLYLRYLNLAGTNICEIPMSIGNLMNLQSLNVSRCRYLQRLTVSITKLQNLRWLDMRECPRVTYVPKGIGQLENLYSLHGFIVGKNDSVSEEGCDLEEVKNLSKLRVMTIARLDRAEGGASALANKPFLKELSLEWKEPNNPEEGEEQISKVERICNEMAQPSSTILKLIFFKYPGLQLPSWMTSSSSLAESFPNLTSLKLVLLPCCMELPPLGTLPQLKHLRIERVSPITSIGSQFLGSKSSAFPKLEVLLFENMPSWEEWTFHGTPLAVRLFPSLRKCFITKCPKLKALPDGLHRATNLYQLLLRQTYELGEIDNLTLAYKLDITNSRGLRKISNIQSLRFLWVGDCPNLECVENLVKLQRLVVICSEETEQLPQWLRGLIEQHNNTARSSHTSLKKFEMQCNLQLLKSCLEGSENWDIIKQIPAVKIETFSGEEYMRYTKDPYIYDPHVPSD